MGDLTGRQGPAGAAATDASAAEAAEAAEVAEAWAGGFGGALVAVTFVAGTLAALGRGAAEGVGSPGVRGTGAPSRSTSSSSSGVFSLKLLNCSDWRSSSTIWIRSA
jgi:hypothetical protein